jgi:hypothetical protein
MTDWLLFIFKSVVCRPYPWLNGNKYNRKESVNMNSRVRADTSKRVNRSILFHVWHRSYIIATGRNSSWYDPGYGSCNVYYNTWKIIFHNFQQYQETFLESTRYLKTDLTIVNKLKIQNVSRDKTSNADHDILRHIITLSERLYICYCMVVIGRVS